MWVCMRFSNGVGKIAYELKLPIKLASVLPVFHISLLKKRISNRVSILHFKVVGVDENLSYEEMQVEILDRQVKKLRSKELSSIKVL